MLGGFLLSNACADTVEDVFRGNENDEFEIQTVGSQKRESRDKEEALFCRFDCGDQGFMDRYNMATMQSRKVLSWMCLFLTF